MRLPVVFLLVWLTAGVAARGMRVAYEKIMMYHAWRIDQLLPLNERTIGVKCAVPPPGRGLGRCQDPVPPAEKYLHCRHQGGECTSFVHFLRHVSQRDYLRLNPHGIGPADQTDFDVERTARRMIDQNLDRPQIPPNRYYKDTVSELVRARQGGGSYNGCLDSVFSRIVEIKRTLPQDVYDANRGLFDQLENGRNPLLRARQADSDHYLKDELRYHYPGIQFREEDLGYDDGQAGDRHPARLIQWPETFEANKWTFPFLEDDIRYRRYEMLTLENDPEGRRRDHVVVIDSLENGGNRIRSTCR